MRGITLQRLQVFCAVYDRGSISAAARALALSQPTVSRHLRDFEHAIGLTLFVLDRGRVVPTAEADAIYGESRFLQDGIDRMETRMERLRDGTGSRLSIMSIGLLMSQFVAPAAAEIMVRMPNLRLSMDVGTAERQLAALRAGQIDLGIMGGRILTESEEVERIGQGRLVALVPRAHAYLKAITLEQVQEIGTVDTTVRGPIGLILGDALRAAGLTPDGNVICNSLIAVPPIAQSLGRAAIVDEYTACAHPLNGMEVLPLKPELTFPIFAVRGTPSGNRIAASAFIDALRLLLKQHAV